MYRHNYDFRKISISKFFLPIYLNKFIVISAETYFKSANFTYWIYETFIRMYAFKHSFPSASLLLTVIVETLR